MKRFLKSLFFPNPLKQRILSGPAKGMYVKYDISSRFQHLCGIYEREIYAYLLKGMNRAKVLIDIGANDGYYIMAFLKSGKKVIACEPGDVAQEIISNAKLNGYAESDNFIIERRFVGSAAKPGFVSVENLIKNIKPPSFFLVDVDGGEFELLNSCGSDFDHTAAIWLIETHTKELEDNCVDFLRKRNYEVSIIKNAWWRSFIPEQRPLDHNRWLFAEPIL